MNRCFILPFLLGLFLSCNNSTSDSDAQKERAKKERPIIKALTKEQKFIAAKLDILFTEMNSKGIFNGSVLVSKGGRVIFQKSLGILDKSTKSNLTDSSMFQLASVSKVITATAVLMLHERKIIDIEKPFSFYFPDFPYADVQVKDLLNHRSGLPNYMYALNAEICQPNYQMNNLDMYNCFIAKNVKPYLKRDTRFNYSNTNYALLALLIEKASGVTYSRFLKDNLFVPLGMKNTATIHDVDLNGHNITRPYDHRWRPVGFDASDYVLGDKSIYSTPYDLYLFSEALYHNKIIKKETQELAYTAFSKEQKLSNYGYGWRLKNFKDPEKKEVYHNGWWHGYRSAFHRRLKDTVTVVILSNQLNSSTYQTEKVYEILDSAGVPDYLNANQ